MEQRTDEWKRARLGCITGSRFGDALTAGHKKGQEFGDTAMSYAYQLAAERLTGLVQDEVFSRSLAWGVAHEGQARSVYQWLTGNVVTDFAFIKHPGLEWVGCSTDGVVNGQDRIIEIKCPYTSREHVRTAHTREVPNQYVAQVQGNMWVTGRSACDFISFDPRMPSNLQVVILDVPRDAAYIEKLAKRVHGFARLVHTITEELRRAAA